MLKLCNLARFQETWSDCKSYHIYSKLNYLKHSSSPQKINSVRASHLQNLIQNSNKFDFSINSFSTSPSVHKKPKFLEFGERKVCVDGIELNIREEGEGSHNILCLPGLIGTIETDFGKIFNAIDKSKFRIISWDPPGYGKSRPPDRHHDPDFFLTDAKLVEKLMNTLGYKKYSILGWSNGGMTGITLAAEYPERVTHLVMWGSHAYVDEEGIRRGLQLCNLNSWSKPMLESMIDIYGQEYLEFMLNNWAESVRESYKSGIHKRLTARIPLVKCPTLVFHGQKDKLLSIEHPHYFAKHINICKVRFVPEGRHNLHLVQTREFLNEVEKLFLSPTKDARA